MDLLSIIGSICSIISLFISLFIAQRVNKILIKGNKNIVASRDVRMGK